MCFTGHRFFANIPRVFLPTMWFEEYADIPPELVQRLELIFNNVPNWLSGGGLFFVIVGAIILVISSIIYRVTFHTMPYTKLDNSFPVVSSSS